MEKFCSSLESKLKEADLELKKMGELKAERDELLIKLRKAEQDLQQLKILLNEREREGLVMTEISLITLNFDLFIL